MRTKKSLRNILIAVVGQSLTIIISFFTRRIFIDNLGPEALGVQSVLNNIVSILSFAELGIGIALVYLMYKPLSENNIPKIQAIMNFYAKTYRIIAITIGVMGIILFPFLDMIIKEDFKNLDLIYFLYVLNSMANYLIVYKKSILIADQKSYIVNGYLYISLFITNILQMMALIYTQSFILFLVIMFSMKMLENLLIARKANKMYPYIKYGKNEKLSKTELSGIFKNIRALAYHKVGSIVTNSSDSLVMSAFINVVTAGLYGNYLVIVSVVNGLLSQIFQAITASVGNLRVTATNDKNLRVFSAVFLANYWLYGSSAIILWSVLDPFISLWLGSEYILTSTIVFFIVLNFFISGMRKAVLTFKNASGLFWQDRYKSILEALINILFSIYLVQHWGVTGVLIGTTISLLSTCVWIEPYVLFKHSFNKSVVVYFKNYLKYSILFFLTLFITSKFNNLITFEQQLVEFSKSLIVGSTLPSILWIIIFRKEPEFQYIFEIFTSIIKK